MTFKEFKEKYDYYDAVYCILKDFDYNHSDPDEVFNNIRKALECYCDGDEWFKSLIKAILSTFVLNQVPEGYYFESDFDFKDLEDIIDKGKYEMKIFDAKTNKVTDRVNLENKDSRDLLISIIFDDTIAIPGSSYVLH